MNGFWFGFCISVMCWPIVLMGCRFMLVYQYLIHYCWSFTTCRTNVFTENIILTGMVEEGDLKKVTRKWKDGIWRTIINLKQFLVEVIIERKTNGILRQPFRGISLAKRAEWHLDLSLFDLVWWQYKGLKLAACGRILTKFMKLFHTIIVLL